MGIEFEENDVGKLKERIAKADHEEINEILEEYEIPSKGEFEKPGCYIQTTPIPVQKEKLKKNDIVLIPLGSTERHGNHSVQGQDLFQASRLAEGVRRYTKKQDREVNLAYSPWPYGWHPYHHIGVYGNIPVSAPALIRQLVDVMFGLWSMGYRKQIFINNHCGISHVIQAMNEFRYRYPQLPIITIALDWAVAAGDFLKTKDKGGEFETDFVHADEVETSLAQLLCPEMVRMEWAEDVESKSYLSKGHFEKSAENLGRPNSWQAREGLVPQEVNETPKGIVGKPTLSDPEKAKKAVVFTLEYTTLLNDHILSAFPPGEVPPIEETTLFNKEDVKSFLKDPDEEGYKNPYRLWNPSR